MEVDVGCLQLPRVCDYLKMKEFLKYTEDRKQHQQKQWTQRKCTAGICAQTWSNTARRETAKI